MSNINTFLLENDLRIATNPCISPDFCLDWQALATELAAGLATWPQSSFTTSHGEWAVAENSKGDCAWLLTPKGGEVPALQDGCQLPDGRHAWPASYANLLTMKNLIQQSDPDATIFPTATGSLGKSTLGVGARFTTLHWHAVEWAMAALDIGLTANQNSIPRELVYDVDAMLEGRLDQVPFPFIGTSVPEGHQGQSVQGMAHGCVLSKLKSGFHKRRIPWSFNADHQPIGGKFDSREDALVDGCLLASYITFDLSPELAITDQPDDPAAWVAANIPDSTVSAVRERVAAANVPLSDDAFHALLAYVWPAMVKMKQRDTKYAAARAAAFTTDAGRAYLRELSIDELPGLTTADTTAVMLALCEHMGMPIHFCAPALGFQKNLPYPDNSRLRDLITAQWDVCRQFDVAIGFHSGSGKSAENYRVMGAVTGGRLEIKTSGRYTYEMGRALAASTDPADAALWRDWHAFTADLALLCAFSDAATERDMARGFIADALRENGKPVDVFSDPATARAAIESLEPSPEHPFWFEYNFLYVLTANGRADKAALGDHTPAGYQQRARFYAISDQAKLLYAKNVASYLIFLAETTGIVSPQRCQQATEALQALNTFDALLSQIAPTG
jgi:hypothetical protein